MQPNDVPKTIADTTDTILKEIIQCDSQNNPIDEISPNCTTAFRVVQMELDFYRATGMPIPHKCPACRREDRFLRRNPRKLWHRSCMKEGCNNEFETSYAPERLEVIYCESCYQKEVV